MQRDGGHDHRSADQGLLAVFLAYYGPDAEKTREDLQGEESPRIDPSPTQGGMLLWPVARRGRVRRATTSGGHAPSCSTICRRFAVPDFTRFFLLS